MPMGYEKLIIPCVQCAYGFPLLLRNKKVSAAALILLPKYRQLIAGQKGRQSVQRNNHVYLSTFIVITLMTYMLVLVLRRRLSQFKRNKLQKAIKIIVRIQVQPLEVTIPVLFHDEPDINRQQSLHRIPPNRKLQEWAARMFIVLHSRHRNQITITWRIPHRIVYPVFFFEQQPRLVIYCHAFQERTSVLGYAYKGGLTLLEDAKIISEKQPVTFIQLHTIQNFLCKQQSHFYCPINLFTNEAKRHKLSFDYITQKLRICYLWLSRIAQKLRKYSLTNL